MSELHIEHRHPEKTKEALQKKKTTWQITKALVVDMVPVILGILIALSFNSIKDGFKERKEEKYFLERLSYDLKEDLRELKEDVSNYHFRQYAVSYIKERMGEPDKLSPNDSCFIYFINLFGQTAPNISNAAYLTLTGSGKLDIIRNKQIVENLVDLYTDVTVSLRNTTTSFNQFKQENLNQVIYEQFDYGELRKTRDMKAVLTNKQIRNTLNLLWFDETIGRYERAIRAHEALIQLIDKELNH